MAQKFYFFRTVKVGGRQRLRPLSGQKEPSGRHIDEGLNVQADSRMRDDYPLGTVFGSESLELRSLHSTTFYSAGQIYPIGLNNGDYHCESHRPSKEMNQAYEDYRSEMDANDLRYLIAKLRCSLRVAMQQLQDLCFFS